MKTFSNDFRKKEWNNLELCEFKLRELKALFQNETPINQDMITEYINSSDILMRKLEQIRNEIIIEFTK